MVTISFCNLQNLIPVWKSFASIISSQIICFPFVRNISKSIPQRNKKFSVAILDHNIRLCKHTTFSVYFYPDYAIFCSINDTYPVRGFWLYEARFERNDWRNFFLSSLDLKSRMKSSESCLIFWCDMREREEEEKNKISREYLNDILEELWKFFFRVHIIANAGRWPRVFDKILYLICCIGKKKPPPPFAHLQFNFQLCNVMYVRRPKH